MTNDLFDFETEAEAIAFVISKAVELEAGTASADYIHLYHGNASLLAESLEVIQQTSAAILALDLHAVVEGGDEDIYTLGDFGILVAQQLRTK